MKNWKGEQEKEGDAKGGKRVCWGVCHMKTERKGIRQRRWAVSEGDKSENVAAHT